METTKTILVLGCGVSGLSTGIELLKRGHTVNIWAKDLPPNTNSDKAAAVWYPYLCFPKEKAIPWAKVTFEYFQREILPDPSSGCVMRTLTKVFDTPQPEPWWKDAYPYPVERPPQTELPPGYTDAYRLQTIVIDTSVYMPYLVKTFTSLGGTIIQKEISDIKEAYIGYDVVVNCTALGSRELFDDEKVFPVRGQMVRIDKSDFDQIVVDDDGPNCLALAVARSNDIMLGGTIQENDWDIEPRAGDTEAILQRVKAIAPSLQPSKILSISVGLRPARDAVRLESEKFGKKTVIHNYGHGGAGFTLSWGCAKEVADIIGEV